MLNEVLMAFLEGTVDIPAPDDMKTGVEKNRRASLILFNHFIGGLQENNVQ